MKKADIGLIGLAVMGENLVMNMESKGFTVAVYNRTVEKVTRFVEGRARGRNILGCKSVEELCAALQKPRKVMLMVKAGQPVDDYIELLCRTWSRATSSSTAAIPTFRTLPAAAPMWRARGFSTSAPAFPAARKVRSRARA